MRVVTALDNFPGFHNWCEWKGQ